LGQRQVAIGFYSKVVSDFAGTPHAELASEKLKALRK
jgi:hypothetical protein